MRFSAPIKKSPLAAGFLIERREFHSVSRRIHQHRWRFKPDSQSRPRMTALTRGHFEIFAARLFQFGFLVDHMLARNRIEFLHLNLVRGSALVLVGGVKMTGAGGRFEFDFFTHDSLL
jgi:hypothetical protein